MNKNSLSKEELSILRAKLPEGSFENIAQRVGLAPASVAQILRKPERHRDDVIDLALEIVETAPEKPMNRVDEFKTRIKAIA